MADKLLGTGEVAGACGVSYKTAQKWMRQGLLPCFRTPGGHRRVREGDLRLFVKEYRLEACYDPQLGDEAVYDQIRRLLAWGRERCAQNGDTQRAANFAVLRICFEKIMAGWPGPAPEGGLDIDFERDAKGGA